jgi:hypothetical protein
VNRPNLEGLPEKVQYLLLVCAGIIAFGAALAPLVYLLRRLGVG